MSMTTTSKIVAITLSHTDLEKIELLDHSQNNWGTWSAKICNYLLLKHGGGYLLSIIMHPDEILDPITLSTRSCTEDQDFLLPFTNTHAAWTALKLHHEQVGPIAQILLIQQDFALCYCHAERFALTSIPKEEDFLMILMLNAMSEELPHGRPHTATLLDLTAVRPPTQTVAALVVDGGTLLKTAMVREEPWRAKRTKSLPNGMLRVISSAFIEELADNAFDALFAAIDLQTSINWHKHSCPVNFVGLTYKAPNQHAHTPVNPSVVPFFLDS
ncbi:hypothetical protein BDR06DRAFT_972624 [Suillus hirtellus]|nr:hypothetical protein BDR06DRAFT_972624 [Suillus hirtellus]